MCKTTTNKRPLLGVVSVIALLAIICIPQAIKAQTCNTTVFGVPYIVGPYPAQPAYIHVWEYASFAGALPAQQQQISVPSGVNACTLTNVKAWIVYPDNTFANFINLNPTLMVPGDIFACDGAAGSLSTPCGTFATSYQVKPTDVANDLSFSTNWPPNSVAFNPNSAGSPDTVQYAIAVAGTAIRTGGGVAAQFPAQGLIVLNPCVSISKICDNTCTPYGDPITFHGVISNCTPKNNSPFGSGTGVEETISIVSVTDDPAAVITPALTTSSGRTFDGTLTNGETLAYTGIYTNLSNPCGPFPDTITVIAADITGYTVTNSATATCHVSTAPAIEIDKVCYNSTNNASHEVPEGSYYVSVITVTNSGNVPLVGVVVHDVDPINGLQNIAIGNLAIAQQVTVSYTNQIPLVGYPCASLTNTATVTATNSCSFDPDCPSDISVSAGPVQCVVHVPCTPKICVYKGVLCGPGPCSPTNDYLKVDTGINGASFCYRIIVENCGTITLTNVQVTDTVLGDPNNSQLLSGFPTTLLPGETATNTYSKTWGAGSTTGTTNFNTVNAVGTGNGVTTNATDMAEAITVPIGVSCEIQLYATFDQDTPINNKVVFPAGTNSAPIQFSLKVCNTGKADLNVSLAGVPALVDCTDDVTPITVPDNTNIAAGDCIYIEGCVIVTCPGTNITVNVQGTAIASLEIPCIYDDQGNAITTAEVPCDATVTCEQGIQCRVTGGGTLYEGDVSTNCINAVTMLHDRLSEAAGLVVDHISHGGQLGAPFSKMVCDYNAPLADPCIRGEWQHVRHYDNKQQGPQDVYDMAFHSANPNASGHYDTLLCGCLPCCGEVVSKAAPPGWNSLKFEVCNKDDRRICGPLPRPAPANAIIFTGLGSFTPSDVSGKGRAAQARYVVFRVYIEDRSEPGGIHPKGANMPGTIYCFQAWDTGRTTKKKLTQTEAETLFADFRRALRQDSCDFMRAMESRLLEPGTLPGTIVDGLEADTSDCGPLRNGSQQIHPSTGATCNK